MGGKGVLANDTDAEGGPLTAVLVDNVDNGTLTFAADGSFRYTARAGFIGTDSFRYRARDASSSSAPATVTINVIDVNDAPVAVADSYATNEDQALNVNASNGVLTNDTDKDSNNLTAVIVTAPSSGTVTLAANGSFNYVPAPDFNGTSTFTYQADDSETRSNTATVTITVNAVNDPPTAQPDSYTTAEDTPLSVGGNGVLGNDTDPDSSGLTAQLVGNVTNGTLQFNSNGTFSYTPPANFNGTTSFSYRASDSALASSPVTVTITVSPVNDAPFVTNAPPTTVTEGVTYSYTLTASDADGNALTIAAPRIPSWLRFTAPARISGTPGDADAGGHDVTMSVSDGTAAPVELKFRVTVIAVDNAPSIATIPDQIRHGDAPVRFRSRKVRLGFRYGRKRAQVRRHRCTAARPCLERRRPFVRHARDQRKRRRAHRGVHGRGRDDDGAGPSEARGAGGGTCGSRGNRKRDAESGNGRFARHLDNHDCESRGARGIERGVARSAIRRRRAVPFRHTGAVGLHDHANRRSEPPGVHAGPNPRRHFDGGER